MPISKEFSAVILEKLFEHINKALRNVLKPEMKLTCELRLPVLTISKVPANFAFSYLTYLSDPEIWRENLRPMNLLARNKWQKGQIAVIEDSRLDDQNNIMLLSAKLMDWYDTLLRESIVFKLGRWLRCKRLEHRPSYFFYLAEIIGISRLD